MALTKVSRGLLSTGIVDNSNATAITIGSDESVTLAGALTVDTNTLVVDATNNRVGIGIAPSYKLTINSGATTETTAAAIGYNGDAGTNLYINTDHGNNLVSLYASGSASKEMRFLSGTLEVMRLGTTGSVGIGTSSPATQLFVKSAANAANVFAIESADAAQRLQFGVNTSNGGSYIFEQKAQALRFGTSDTERMRIDGASGNLLVGSSTSTGSRLSVIDTATASKQIVFGNNSTYYGSVGHNAGTGYNEYRTESGGKHGFYSGTSATPDLTIDQLGRLLVNTTSILTGSSAKLQVLQTVSGHWSTRINNSTTLPFGLALSYTGAAPNNGSSHFLYFADTAAGRFQVTSNGNVGSATSSYGGMSDLKLKENVVDADSQWDDLKSVRVRKYSFKEENSSEPTQIGVIAQEVEAAGMAGLVYESPDLDTAEDGSFVDTGKVTKNMKYSILYMKAVKALQEAMERIETLEAKVQTLEIN